MGTTFKDIEKQIEYGLTEKESIKRLLLTKENLLAAKADRERELWRDELDKKRHKRREPHPMPWDTIMRDLDIYAKMVSDATETLNISVPDKHIIYTNYVAGEAPYGRNPRFEKGDMIDLFVVKRDDFSNSVCATLSSNLVASEYTLTPDPARVNCEGDKLLWFDEKHFANYLQKNWSAIYTNALDRLAHIIRERVSELNQKEILLVKETRHLENELSREDLGFER